MSGGIFPNYPFQLNIKCIIFTVFIAGGYWWLPKKNWIVLFFLLWLPYIVLAWYDYVYQCQYKMQPTLIPFGRYAFLPFKPPDYKKAFNELPTSAKNDMDRLDHITLWTIIIASLGASVWYFVLHKK